MTELVFYVNGRRIIEHRPNPEQSLLGYIRNDLLLTGTKLSCGQGGCGACTILVSKFDFVKNDIVHLTVNACLMPLCWAHGMSITTIEGLGNTDNISPLQKSIADAHGSQCGFCTPGMVMSVCGALCKDKQPTQTDIEDTLSGNLCRCTGYRPIFEGFRSYAKDVVGNDAATECLPKIEFPQELLSPSFREESARFSYEGKRWFRPTTLEELLQLKKDYPKAPIAQGLSSLVWAFRAGVQFPVVISASAVRELYHVTWEEGGVHIGAGTPIYSLLDTLTKAQEILPAAKTRMISSMMEMLSSGFGSPQLRNIATIGGSIANGSRTSDIIVIFSILNCEITVVSKETGSRRVRMDEAFLQSPRSMLAPGEVIQSVFLPFSTEFDYYFMCKHLARAGGNTVSSYTMRMRLSSDYTTIQETDMSFGGIGKGIIKGKITSERLSGEKFCADVVQIVNQTIKEDFGLSDKRIRKLDRYKLHLGANMFMKFFTEISLDIELKKTGRCTSDPGFASPRIDPPQGVQVYEATPGGQEEQDAVGRPLVHRSAYQQSTGEAVYVDDIPTRKGELHLVFVMSKHAHARIVSVDTEKALQLPGVVGYIDHRNVHSADKTPFATDKVLYQGHPVGAVVAETRDIAKRASRLVQVQYEVLAPVVTVEEAMAAGSLTEWSRVLKEGDLERGFQESDAVLEGRIRIGAQEHFYMEPQSCLAVPNREENELEIFASSQNPTGLQGLISKSLGIKSNKINVRTKRLGGGFGGKDMNCSAIVAVPAGLAAKIFKHSVRCVLDRDEDMLLTGTKPSYIADYKVGFLTTGEIKAVQIDWFGNGGIDGASPSRMMTKGLAQMENCYRIPNLKFTARVCRTNISPRAAFRGYGGSDAHFITETWLSKVAEHAGISQTKVREINMYRDGDRTPINHILNGFNGRRCWDQVLEQADYNRRLQDIQEYNINNTWKKRGIAVVPVKMSACFGGIISGFAFAFSQAAALVNIYQDGTVLISHHATEMGQGIHTKIIQVASRALGVPASKIHISETKTGVLANGSTTGASTGSDLNGIATMRACQQILKGLEPLRKKLDPEISWEELVFTAYCERIPLTALGTFKQEGFDVLDWEKKDTNPYPYFTYGAGVTEVEVDCLTGNHTVLRTDIVMDVGKSLNPAIDIGQIEGAYVQAYGSHTLEQIECTADGKQIPIGPGFYAIPGIKNIPREMNVTLLKESENPYTQAVYSSKGIGEPPMTLAISAFLAIKMAVSAARAEAGASGDFRFDSPATYDKILSACEMRNNPVDADQDPNDTKEI